MDQAKNKHALHNVSNGEYTIKRKKCPTLGYIEHFTSLLPCQGDNSDIDKQPMVANQVQKLSSKNV